MGVLSAAETLKILATGKATLKEIVELEGKAAEELLTPPPSPAPEQTTPPAPEQTTPPAPEQTTPQDNTPDNTPDEKDTKIAELENKLADLESKLKEAQQANINANNGGVEPSFEEQLDTMFKGYRY